MTHFPDDERENRLIDPSNTSDEHSSEGSPDEAMDPNRLAALIDGQLTEHDRAELIETIGPAEAAGVLSDAIAALADVEETPATTPARRRHWHPGVWLALAACVAGVLLLPVTWLRTHRPANAGPEQYAALLAAQGVRVPADWNDTPWAVTRGPEELPPEARAFRIGVRVTDLLLAVRQRDSAEARYADEVASLASQIPGEAPVAAVFHRIAAQKPTSASAASSALINRAIVLVASLPDSEYVQAGAWLEAARIAAAAHNRAFFVSGESRAVAGGAARLYAPRAVQSANHLVQRDPQQLTSDDWNMMRVEAEHAMARLGH